MKKFVARLMGWKYVALLDFNGVVTFRFAKPTPFGFVANRWSGDRGNCLLVDGGEVKGPCYVKEWREVE